MQIRHRIAWYNSIVFSDYGNQDEVARSDMNQTLCSSGLCNFIGNVEADTSGLLLCYFTSHFVPQLFSSIDSVTSELGWNIEMTNIDKMCAGRILYTIHCFTDHCHNYLDIGLAKLQTSACFWWWHCFVTGRCTDAWL